jgi:hypothetical protein
VGPTIDQSPPKVKLCFPVVPAIRLAEGRPERIRCWQDELARGSRTVAFAAGRERGRGRTLGHAI